MDEISDEQSNYEEYQGLIEALKAGAEQLEHAPGQALSVWHIGVLNGMKMQLENPEYFFSVYHRTSKPPTDHQGERIVWDLKVEYNGSKVPLRHLVQRLELLWNESRMLNEGGA